MLHCGDPDCTMDGHTAACDEQNAKEEREIATERDYQRQVYRLFAGLPDLPEEKDAVK